MKRVKISVYVDEKVNEKLKELAVKDGRPLSNYIDKVVIANHIKGK
jgi:predicted DNA-binding protein